jgi:hypothetical protein
MQHPLSVLGRGDPTIRADDPEPALRDLLDDSVLMLVLKSDRVRPADLRRVIERAQARLGLAFAARRVDRAPVDFDCLV